MYGIGPFASEFLIGDSTASDMTHSHLKTVPIANEVVLLGAIVVPENLFVQITEQVERLNVDVRSLESALEQAPEVFESVRVNLSVHIALSMVNRLVDEVLVIQSLIGHGSVSVDRARCFDVSANLSLQVALFASGNDIGVNLAPALQDAHHSGLALHSAVGNLLAAFISVHESRRATDESFVDFDFLAASAELYGLLLMQGKTNAVHHEPCGLLSDSESASDFVGTDSVLGVHDEPNGNHPLVHAERGILKDSSNLDGELFLAGFAEPDTRRSFAGR